MEVVGREPPRELPDPLHRRELRAVRRQEQELEAFPVPVQVWLEEPGVVVARVVEDHDHPHAPRPPARQGLEEGQKGLRVECRGEGVDELPGPQADGAEAGDGLARRRVEDDGVPVLRRHPEAAARPVALEVALVLAPQLDILTKRQFHEFF